MDKLAKIAKKEERLLAQHIRWICMKYVREYEMPFKMEELCECGLVKTRGPNTAGEMVCPIHCSKCGHDRKFEDHLDYCSECGTGDPCG